MDISTQYIKPIAAVSSTNKEFYERHNTDHSLSREELAAIEQTVGENANIWAELSEKYDIRNSSFNELCEISAKLYQAGQIYLFDHAMLTFDPNSLAHPAKAFKYLTTASSDGKRDWIAEHEARVKRDLENGNTIGYKVNKNVLTILERLQK